MAKGAASIKVPMDIAEHEARLYLAMKMYELGKMTIGQAAEYSGYSLRAFIEILGKHGVPIFNQTPEELEEDVKNASRSHS